MEYTAIKEAYSPYWNALVRITSAYQDTRGEWILKGDFVDPRDNQRMVGFLFRPSELSHFTA